MRTADSGSSFGLATIFTGAFFGASATFGGLFASPTERSRVVIVFTISGSASPRLRSISARLPSCDASASFCACCGETSRVTALATEGLRSEEHTSELQSLMRISYAVFCLKKKINTYTNKTHNQRRIQDQNNH